MRRFTTATSRRATAAAATTTIASSSSSSFSTTVLARQGKVENQVAGGGAKLAPGEVNPAKITKQAVWGLWNEGNLFSLSQAELAAFLKQNDKPVDEKAKKSALIRQVEEIMGKESPTITNEAANAESVQSVTQSQANVRHAEEALADLYDETDVYGDWGAEPGFEEKREMDFISVSLASLNAEVLEKPTASRAFQLLHSDVTTDVGLAKVNPTALPGCEGMKSAFLPASVTVENANKIRWRNSFKWSVSNLWNANLDGELNIGAGKALYWRGVAKEYKKVLPIWACQDHLHSAHPYSWFAVAHDSNTQPVEQLAAQLGMKLTQEAETSYRVNVKRSRDWIDVNLNQSLQATAVNRPWDRYLVSHYLRNKMPDLRYLVRARVPIKKKVADVYFDAPMVKVSNETVQSVLSPELGDIVYCCERVIRKWSVPLAEAGAKLQLVETKRTPLIVQRQGEEGERLEYELIVNIPQQAQRIDINNMADNLWEKGNEFCNVLEEGMSEFQAYTMQTAAAFFEKE